METKIKLLLIFLIKENFLGLKKMNIKNDKICFALTVSHVVVTLNVIVRHVRFNIILGKRKNHACKCY